MAEAAQVLLHQLPGVHAVRAHLLAVPGLHVLPLGPEAHRHGHRHAVAGERAGLPEAGCQDIIGEKNERLHQVRTHIVQRSGSLNTNVAECARIFI